MPEYEVWSPAGSQPDPSPARDPAVPQVERWQVLVEFAAPANTRPTTEVVVFPVVFDTRAEALAEAEHQAVHHEPPDPTMPQGREVYADGEGFLTVVQGAMSVYHFSTRVVRLITST